MGSEMSKGETMKSSPTPLTPRLQECSEGVPPAGENPSLAGGVPNAGSVAAQKKGAWPSRPCRHWRSFSRRTLSNLRALRPSQAGRLCSPLFRAKSATLGGSPALQKTGLQSGFEMILESPITSIQGDALSTPTALPARAKEKATHGAANLERFARFITQRVMNFSPSLKTLQKTRELEFGTHCVPNFRCCLLAASCGLTEKMNYRKAKAWNQPN